MVFPFVNGLVLAEGVGNAPTPGLDRSCFQDRCSQLISACLPEMVRVERIALPTSSFQARPSAADLHPEKMVLTEGISPSSPMLEASRSII